MPNKKLFASLLFVAACGNPPGDGQADAHPATNVAAIVTDADGPVAGVDVAFVDPDGTTTELKTGDDGRAEAVIKAGASVTAQVGGLTTVLDVQPGDAITFEPSADPTPGKDAGQLMISFDADKGATSYALYTSCSQQTGATSPMGLPVHSSCGAHGPLLAVATDASGMIGYAVDKDVQVGKGSYALKSAWQAPDTFTASFAGIDPKLSSLKVAYATQVDYTTDHADVAVAAATADAPLTAALGLPSGLAITLADATGAHHQTYFRPIAGGETKASIDLSKDLLAWVTGVTYDAKARTATVAVSSTDTGAMVEVDLAYGKNAWHVFGPSSDQPSVALPTLPASFTTLEPGASDAVTAGAALIDSSEKYDTLKTIAPWAIWHYTGHTSAAAFTKIRISN